MGVRGAASDEPSTAISTFFRQEHFTGQTSASRILSQQPYPPEKTRCRQREPRAFISETLAPLAALALPPATSSPSSAHALQLENPRLLVPNEYLAGWALTQNDTACLERFGEMGYCSGEETTRRGGPFWSGNRHAPRKNGNFK